VNLHFTREHPALQVEYALEGDASLLRLNPPGAGPIYVRIPENMKADRITISDSSGNARIEGGYIRIDKPEKEVRLEWPMEARTTKWIQTNTDKSFTISWKGNVVVGVEPDGGRFGLYRQDKSIPWG